MYADEGTWRYVFVGRYDTFHIAKALSTAGCKFNHSFNTRGLISTVITDTSSMSSVRLKLYSKIATIIFTSVYCLYPFVIPRRVNVSFKALNKASWSSGWSIRIWFNSLFGLLALKTKSRLITHDILGFFFAPCFLSKK